LLQIIALAKFVRHAKNPWQSTVGHEKSRGSERVNMWWRERGGL